MTSLGECTRYMGLVPMIPSGNRPHRIDPNLPVTKVQTCEHALGQSRARERLNAVVRREK